MINSYFSDTEATVACVRLLRVRWWWCDDSVTSWTKTSLARCLIDASQSSPQGPGSRPCCTEDTRRSRDPRTQRSCCSRNHVIADALNINDGPQSARQKILRAARAYTCSR